MFGLQRHALEDGNLVRVFVRNVFAQEFVYVLD